MISSFKTKNHFIEDLKNPIFIGVTILLVFVNLYLPIIFLVMFLLYISWLSNVIEITETELMVTYPNWIFWRRCIRIEINQIERVLFEHSIQGAYATIPFFDVFLKGNIKKRILYTPSISKDEYEKFVNIIIGRVGN